MTYVDVTVAGDLNIDIIVNVTGEVLEDSSTITSDAKIMPGGVGANIASNIVHLGMNARVLGAVGDDVLGRFLIEKLSMRRIDVGDIEIIGNVSTGFMIVLVSEKGKKTIIGSRGANEYFELVENKIYEVVERTRHIHVSGYMALNKDGGRTLVELLRASKGEHRTTSIDLEGIAQYSPDFIYKIKGLVDYVFMNKIEAQRLCETNDPVDCSIKTLLKINARALFLKIGEQGSIVLINGDEGLRTIRVDPFKTLNPIDCTGAGDAYNAAVIVSLLNGESFVEAARKGNRQGALACERIGGFI